MYNNNVESKIRAAINATPWKALSNRGELSGDDAGELTRFQALSLLHSPLNGTNKARKYSARYRSFPGRVSLLLWLTLSHFY